MSHWTAAIKKAFPAELDTHTVKDEEGQCKQDTLSVLISVLQMGDKLKTKKILVKCWDTANSF